MFNGMVHDDRWHGMQEHSGVCNNQLPSHGANGTMPGCGSFFSDYGILGNLIVDLLTDTVWGCKVEIAGLFLVN